MRKLLYPHFWFMFAVFLGLLGGLISAIGRLTDQQWLAKAGLWLCAPCALANVCLVGIVIPLVIFANWKHNIHK